MTDKIAHPAHGLTRRRLLALSGGSALALLTGLPSLAAEGVSEDEFVKLSARLLETDASSLDADIAAKYLAGFEQTGRLQALSLLAGGTGDKALEEEIITAWYSGVHRTAQGEEVATYTDALIWTALDYTKPQGWCGGDTGYWSEPPSA